MTIQPLILSALGSLVMLVLGVCPLEFKTGNEDAPGELSLVGEGGYAIGCDP